GLGVGGAGREADRRAVLLLLPAAAVRRHGPGRGRGRVLRAEQAVGVEWPVAVRVRRVPADRRAGAGLRPQVEQRAALARPGPVPPAGLRAGAPGADPVPRRLHRATAAAAADQLQGAGDADAAADAAG